MERRNVKLMCIIPIDDVNNKMRFKAGSNYKVLLNHPHLISMLDESGYKMNFTKRENDIVLPYIWDYFYEDGMEIVEETMEKLK